MTKSLKKNYFFNTAYQLLTIIIPFITMPYVSRVLLPEGIGVYSFTSSIISYFVLFAVLGTNTYGQREISYLQDNREERTTVFWNIVTLRLISSSILLASYLVFVWTQNDYRVIYLVLSLNLINVALDVTWLLQGVEDFQVVAIRNCIIKILFTVFIFVFVKQADDLWIYALGLGGSTLVGSISLWFSVPKLVDRPRLKKIRPLFDIKTVLSLFIPTIAGSIYTMLDKTMIGLLTSDMNQNGYYEQAMKISKMALMVVTSLGAVMVPRIGHLFAHGVLEELKQYMYKSYRFVWLLGIPLCLGLVSVSRSFVPWFFGEDFLPVIPILQISSFLILAIGINNVTGIQYLIPTKRQNLFSITVLVGAGLNFILNLILIPKYQAVGAAISSVAAETVIAIAQLLLVRKELSIKQIAKSSNKYLISGLLMLLIVGIIGSFLPPTPLNTVLLIAIGTGCYFAILVVMKDPFLLENLKRKKS